MILILERISSRSAFVIRFVRKFLTFNVRSRIELVVDLSDISNP